MQRQSGYLSGDPGERRQRADQVVELGCVRSVPYSDVLGGAGNSPDPADLTGGDQLETADALGGNQRFPIMRGHVGRERERDVYKKLHGVRQ